MESGVERAGRERTGELEAAHEALRRSEQLLALEVEAAQRLQQVAIQLIAAQGAQALYEQILDTAQSLVHADFASIQMFHPERGELRLLGHHGFNAEAAKRWEWVSPSTRTTCGRALRTGEMVLVPDVRTCEFMAGSEDLEGYLATGIRAAQSLPLISRPAALLGMVTTYWREPHQLSASESRALEALARLAAACIERSRLEEALRENQQRLASICDTVSDVLFHVAVEPEGRFRFVSVNAAFLRVTGLSREMVVGKTVNEIIPEPSLTMVLGKYRQAIEEKSAVLWEETSDYPTGRLTGEVSIVPVFDEKGTCTYLVGSVHDITEPKRAEQATSEREQQLRIAKDAAKLGIYDYDIATGTIVWDARVRELWDVPPDMPVTIDTFFEGLHLEDRSKTKAILDRALDPAGNGEYYAEYRVIGHADGSERWVAATGQVFFQNGRPVHIIGTGQDISERKRAEAELRESEERFRNMADTAPVMIWVTGPDGLCTFVNRTWLNFTGRTLEEELGMGWAVCVHPDDRQRHHEAFRSAFDARQTFQVESRWRRADGEYRLVLCTGVPRFASGGNFAGYIGSKIDITDLQSEKRFRQLAENIDDVFWMLDIATERVLYVSPAFEKVWGINSAALYQNRSRVIDTVHAEDRDRCTAFFSKLKSEPVEETYRIVRPDGSIRWIHDRAFLVCDPEGKPYRVAGIAEDVTAHRELEEALRQAYKMEAIGKLAGGVAHDFNNLLTVVGGYLQLVLDATPPSDPRHDKLQHILTASNRASMLTSQLLAFTRKQMIQPKSVNVNKLLTGMEALLRPVMGEHIQLVIDLGSDLPCVKADPNQLEQVVMNLAVNARDAMPKGGEFHIRTALGKPLVQAGSGRDTGACVRIQMSDTGCGMGPDVMEHVFEPFFTTKGVGKGTGLGLSTVYGIVQQNHGTIHVSSSPGRGTTFEILLPASQEGEDSNLATSAPEKLRGTESILVVEDEPGLRKLVCETLNQLGYAVLQAEDGREALRVLEEQRRVVDVILTDVIMPTMGGPELAKRVRSLAPGTKVIYMSGYTDDSLELYGPPHPDTEFIQKPFTPAALAEKLRQVLSTVSGAGESKLKRRLS
jgi:PAS domain S-box-containing protein